MEKQPIQDQQFNSGIHYSTLSFIAVILMTQETLEATTYDLATPAETEKVVQKPSDALYLCTQSLIRVY